LSAQAVPKTFVRHSEIAAGGEEIVENGRNMPHGMCELGRHAATVR